MLELILFLLFVLGLSGFASLCVATFFGVPFMAGYSTSILCVLYECAGSADREFPMQQ